MANEKSSPSKSPSSTTMYYSSMYKEEAMEMKENDPLIAVMESSSTYKKNCSYLCRTKPLVCVAVVTLCLGLLCSIVVSVVQDDKTSDTLEVSGDVRVKLAATRMQNLNQSVETNVKKTDSSDQNTDNDNNNDDENQTDEDQTDEDQTDEDQTDDDQTDDDQSDEDQSEDEKDDNDIYLHRALQLMAEVPLIDGHNDLAYYLREKVDNHIYTVDLNSNLTDRWNDSQTDIPRLRRGRVGAQFWSCFVSSSTQYTDAVRVTLDQFDTIHRFINAYQSTFKFVDSAQGIMDAFKEKKIGGLIGIEGGHSIDSSLATLRMFYKLGARYMTLAHTISTPWVDAAEEDNKSGPGPNNGLSKFGRRVVLEMNRLGMAVDLSHISVKAQLDSIKFSHAPVIFSHSGAYSLCPHHRNVHDEVLTKLKEKDGIVMVPFVVNFTSCSTSSNLSIVADHIEYVRTVAGSKHVGIGSDFDGMGGSHPVGLEDVSKYPDLIAELLRRGWTDKDIKLLLGENFIRVFTGIENIRDTLQRQYTRPDDHLISPEEIPDATCRPDF